MELDLRTSEAAQDFKMPPPDVFRTNIQSTENQAGKERGREDIIAELQAKLPKGKEGLAALVDVSPQRFAEEVAAQIHPLEDLALIQEARTELHANESAALDQNLPIGGKSIKDMFMRVAGRLFGDRLSGRQAAASSIELRVPPVVMKPAAEAGPMADFAAEFGLKGSRPPKIGFIDEAALAERGENTPLGRLKEVALQKIRIFTLRDHLTSAENVWADKREAVLGRALPDLEKLKGTPYQKMTEAQRKIWNTAEDLVADIKVVDNFRIAAKKLAGKKELN